MLDQIKSLLTLLEKGETTSDIILISFRPFLSTIFNCCKKIFYHFGIDAMKVKTPSLCSNFTNPPYASTTFVILLIP